MEKVKGIFVLDEKEKPIITYKNGETNPDNLNLEWLIRILKSLKDFANGFDENLNSISIGDFKYIYTIDNLSKTKFIIQLTKDISEKKYYPIVKEIKNLYINEFIGDFTMTKKEIEEAKTRFKEKLTKSLERRLFSINDFLASL
ncbi:MAG: hypothetical protein BAJALOKI2v1_730010 [Promethearchaeota archaeon]|nr:MAG: hypothetical protein BAJALOKI2v1_730010 [Candidatus Lokiarchaeota archaeon]